MAKIFCGANQKGGVGKTTTTLNLAASLAKIGQRVLMVDLDPQGNATMGSGVDKRKLELTIYDVLLESATVAEARVKSEKLIAAGCSYDILGANRELAGAEIEMVGLERRENRMKTALATVADDYDFILIDCPPSLSLLTLNGLCSANGVIVPMQCEYFALEGLTDLVNTIKQVHANLNKELVIIGLLRVMCLTRASPCKVRSASNSRPTLAARCLTPSFPATCDWPRPPAMACRGWCLTPLARARRRLLLLPMRWSNAVNNQHEMGLWPKWHLRQ